MTTTVIWILYWLMLLTASTGVIYWCIEWFSHGELDEYVKLQTQRDDQRLLEYLKTKKTALRIKNRPEL